jgi:hypothetical protein
MGEIKNAELKIKNDEAPGKAGQSGGDPAAAFFKMTFSTVMAGCWHKNRNSVTPLWTAFHLYNYFWRFLCNFGIFENFEAKKPKLPEGINTRTPRPKAK